MEPSGKFCPNSIDGGNDNKRDTFVVPLHVLRDDPSCFDSPVLLCGPLLFTDENIWSSSSSSVETVCDDK